MAWEAAWLALLDEAALEEAIRQHYRRNPRYAHGGFNTSGLFAWEEEAVTAVFPESGRIFVVACGGGRELAALRDLGYDVYGSDADPAYVEAAQRLLGDDGRRVALVGPRESGLAGRPFDVVVLGWPVYSHLPGRDRRIALLRECAGAVGPGGLVMLSAHVEGEEQPSRPTLWKHRVATGLQRLVPWNHRPIEMGDHLRGWFGKVFTARELEAEMIEAGLEVIYCDMGCVGWVGRVPGP